MYFCRIDQGKIGAISYYKFRAEMPAKGKMKNEK